MSLFVAVRPDDAAIGDLTEAVTPVRRLPACAALRWQPPGQWHVTLAFLGAAGDVVADAVAERLETMPRPAAVPRIRLVGAGCFGRQILWAGLGDAGEVAALASIAGGLPALLRGTGAQVDRRPWRPHLTLARARRGDARPAAEALAGYAGPRWSASTVLLVRSEGGPHPAHHVMHTVRLGPDR